MARFIIISLLYTHALMPVRCAMGRIIAYSFSNACTLRHGTYYSSLVLLCLYMLRHGAYYSSLMLFNEIIFWDNDPLTVSKPWHFSDLDTFVILLKAKPIYLERCKIFIKHNFAWNLWKYIKFKYIKLDKKCNVWK